MLPSVFRRTFLGLLLWPLACLSGTAGMTSYTDRGKTDFDTAMGLLNPYGTWSQVQGEWAYTPLDRHAPYTDGQWLYTEYGWYWQGRLPDSWVTEHYGYWKRGLDNIWSWYPGPSWYPQTVELRATSTHIGWRSAEVDRDGVFVEAPEDRYAKIGEWNFATLAQFAAQITPGVLAKPEKTETLLEDSVDSHHTYLTYREIDRVGPHPADFTGFPPAGMLAPVTLEEKAANQASPAKAANVAPSPTNPVSSGDPVPPDNTRQVKYWITMSLPNFWAKPPVDAKPTEIYLYRPDFYQDEDGIKRRILLWLHPESRGMVQERLDQVLGRHRTTTPASGETAPAVTPAIPAAPEAKSRDPFRSPFDETVPPASDQPHIPPGKSSPATTNAAPSGRVEPPSK